MTARRFTTGLLALALAACGGDDDAADRQQRYVDAVAAANAKEVQTRALAVATPCATAAQCGVVRFRTDLDTCDPGRFHVYSTVSPTASAASAAAAEHLALFNQAKALAPTQAFCPAVEPTPPATACVAGACQAAAR